MPTPAESTFFESTSDALRVATYRWSTSVEPPRGVVQIAHGVAEHAARYARLAGALTSAGYEVYAHDHRGHGASVDANTPLGDFGRGAWPALVADIVQFGRVIQSEHPDLKLFLLAHSMGSFAAQELLLENSDLYDGVVLSGSTALDVLATSLAEANGGGPVELTAFNAAFENRTGYEWLSRDAVEVDAYVADPLSGFGLADSTVPQLFSGAERLADPIALGGIRSDLPLLVISGQDDPLAGEGALVSLLAERYTDAGVTDVELRLYAQARHEIFNETNRDEITAFVVAWLHAHS